MQAEIPARRAAVAPRVRSCAGGAVLPLELHVRRMLDQKLRGAVLVDGPLGAGKSTALSHLRAVLPSFEPIELLDDPQLKELYDSPQDRLTIAAASGDIPGKWLARFELAEWTDDDVIEYLATTHRDRCRELMARVMADPHRHMLRVAELWHIVLEEMASDDSITDVFTALRKYLGRVLPAGPTRSAISQRVAWMLFGEKATIVPSSITSHFDRLSRHYPIRTLLASEYIVSAIHQREWPPQMDNPLPADLLHQTALLVREQPATCERLKAAIEKRRHRTHASFIASIMLAVDPTWHPKRLKSLFFNGGRLAGAHWPEVDLRGSRFRSTDLFNADLRGARLEYVSAAGCDFSGANLSSARADNCAFRESRLMSTNFCEASLRSAAFYDTNLQGADFVGADLAKASFDQTALDGADFTDADFTSARFSDINLAVAKWRRATFIRAVFQRCNFEGLDLDEADFSNATLAGCYLTGSSARGANFDDANLTNTGLAEIDWPNASLRGADLRGASFHMGSTRSGLVGSTIASEGTRTGFYTDDYHDQDFKSPEEIRKANLCGADLRGAEVEDVDFYLVDLRGAKYSAEQEEHFRRCGAILRSQVE